MNEDELIFIPKINEEEYMKKRDNDFIVLKEREKEAKKREEEYLASIGRDSKLIDVAEIIQDIFPLFIASYDCIINEHFDELQLHLLEIIAYVEKNYNQRCSSYAVYIWDVWMVDMFLENGDLDDITTYIEQGIVSIYEFSNKYYKLNLENDLLSENELEDLSKAINI